MSSSASSNVSAASEKPRIAVSIGDPAGIGPEVTVKALADSEIAGLGRFLVVGDRRVLEQAATTAGVAVPREIVDAAALGDAEIPVGRADAACGRAAMEYIRRATQLCLDGEADALTTAPVNKEAIVQSGASFTGHTEYIAELSGARDSRMLLVSERMRVLHVTTHVSLRRACDATVERIRRTIELGDEALRQMGLERRKIAVCGLNPHAGEHGLFGDEDSERIAPAVDQARGEGIDCHGPLPADTLFLRAYQGEFDLVIAMYHDQGHIPMKLVDFAGTVNVSLGLPLIRTSVDHGTAFDIAGKNQADPANMKAALRLAATMARRQA